MLQYPLLGVFFFLRHPSLWNAMIIPFFFVVGLSIVLTGLFFGAVLKPQALAMDRVMASGLAWTLSVLLVLAYIFISVLIISLISIPCCLDGLFDRVLALKGCPLVDDEQEGNENSCARSCRACCTVSVGLKIIVSIVTLPLNLIPFVGTALWVVINSPIIAWEMHMHYFDLKGFSYEQQRSFIAKHAHEYTAFGTISMSLQLIPILGAFFMFTNVVGAALWAADLESPQAAEELPAKQLNNKESEKEAGELIKEQPTEITEKLATDIPAELATDSPEELAAPDLLPGGIAIEIPQGHLDEKAT